MIIAGVYSFNHGREIIEAHYATELAEVREVIASVNSEEHKSKVSREKTMTGRSLYSPKALNRAFKAEFATRDWHSHRELCVYSSDYYTPEYQAQVGAKTIRAYREMDCVKNKVGVEVQFGKYAFMVYNVAAKMTIFKRLGVIDVGIEIVPIKAFAKEMSTGVSYFEQFVWDLEHRGIADIDIPVLILGVMRAS
jgi:hypothetical protein